MVMNGSFFPYASVSESCESMIRYTAGLEKCFRVLCPTHIFRVLGKHYRMVGDSVLRGDAVIRVIMWVVACHIQVWVPVCVECIALIPVLHVSCCGWAEMSFL